MGLLDKIKTENTADRYLPFIRSCLGSGGNWTAA